MVCFFSCSIDPTLCNPMDCSSPGLPVLHQLLELTQAHVRWVSDDIQRSHPLSSLFLLPSSSPRFTVISSESALRIRWPKYWSFSFKPSNEYSDLISFRIDWFDPFVVQRTLKSLLQHHSSKASILQLSAFFMVQLSCADLREMLCLEISPSSSPLATWCEKPIHGKRPWCWERLRAGGEGGDRGWDG